MKNNIILIGYMGCGKSTIGRKMSEIFQCAFVDTDSWIEEKEGLSVSEIFSIKGEACFRDLETECIKHFLQNGLESESCEGRKEGSLTESGGSVISVGGGLPVREENQKLLRKLGRVIYLKAKPDTIYERLQGDTTRPLLQTENLLQKIKDMIAAREEKYQAAAHEVINVDGKSIAEIMEEIVKNEKIQ